MTIESGDSEVAKQIDAICYQALNTQWPGRHGPRNLQALVGVLNIARGHGRLSFIDGFAPLGAEIGLVRFEGLRAALLALEEDSWLTLQLGTPDEYDANGQVSQRGRPSRITLRPKSADGELDPGSLPDPGADIFRYSGGLGSAGWFAVTKLQIELENRRPLPELAVSVGDLVRLTGLSTSRAERLLPRISSAFGGRKIKTKYCFSSLEVPLADTVRKDSLLSLQSERRQLRQRGLLPPTSTEPA